MKFAKVVLWVFSIITLAFGALSLVSPEAIANAIKVDPLTPGALTEIRSFYGGLELGLAAFWIAGAQRAELLKPALVSMVMIWGAVALSRIYGLVIDGGTASTLYVALASELAAAILAFVALSRLPAKP
ncbi:MAG: DUF4345 domain-containing protein [Pseudomonadota bacterium]